jgi:predicted lipoprotein with Yx(FWY)xxD motif
VAAIVLAALVAGIAVAATSPQLRAKTNAKLGKTIVVNSHGRTVYWLSPETTHHLLCTSATCFGFWPPVTVRSRSVHLVAGPGIQGKLGILRRSNGKLQLTLRGMPLYTFAGDSAAGEVNGEGIQTFGGTWHAVTAKAHSAGAPAPAAPAPQPAAPNGSPPAPGYGD